MAPDAGRRVGVGRVQGAAGRSRGFERYYGFLGGKTNQWAPTLVHDSHYIDPPRTPEEGYHLNADLADHAIEFLTDLRHRRAGQAVLHVLLPGRGHAPHHVEPEWADPLPRANTTRAGTTGARSLRAAGGPGIAPRNAVSPRPPWVKEGFAVRRRAPSVRAAARSLRRIPGTDGPSHRARHRFPGDAGRARQHDCRAGIGQRRQRRRRRTRLVQRIGRFPNRVSPTIEQNRERLDEWGSVRSYPNHSWGWAWAGNTPLRRWKRYLHQGGMSDPLIVHWPKGIAARGEVRGQYVHVVDLAPTILEALALEPPH
ncbi:MAG: sulfatase-like hydrolase/transferase [Betaproteobacteria bacterium]|nr:sulfatase-like hydrolase/transferase [Betaproteobacteria bacterium]